MSTIEGTVTDGSGAGIANAEVTITESGSDTFVADTTTDDTGFYVVSGLSADTYDVRATKFGYEPIEQTGVTVGSSETVTVNLSTTRVTYKVRGEFTDAYGIGVLGRNTVGSGQPIGVLGSIPNASDGYGVVSRDDARLEGAVDTAGTDFVVEAGTTDTEYAQNVVLGHASNTATSGVQGAVIGGGGFDSGSSSILNIVTGNGGTVGGGVGNRATRFATVGGGRRNCANYSYVTVGGGFKNEAFGNASTIAGGRLNKAHGSDSTIGGGAGIRTGTSGTDKGSFATVPGGENVVAREDYSFAAGREAYARAKGSFVWGDSSTDLVESLTQDEVVFQASGGTVIWSNSDNTAGVQLPSGGGSWESASARTQKTDIDPVEPERVLEKVTSLDVSTWEYETRPGVRHMGPMAGEFQDTFELGDDPDRISTVDADGVALAAIQGLAERLEEKDDRIDWQAARIDELEAENDQKTERIAELEADRDALETENDRLRDRLATIEDHLSLDATPPEHSGQT